jgi:uracil-DNA glycosylase
MSSLLDQIPDFSDDWRKFLELEFLKPYFFSLNQFLIQETKSGKIVYPKSSEIFSAFALTPLHSVKVVILGQDPYHGQGQAHGLSFSVPEGMAIPPSLRNILKEIESDLGRSSTVKGNLSDWAKQGVFLLNSVLTVQAGEAGSHRNKGWEMFTDEIIKILAHQQSNLVFLLWGSYAISKKSCIPPEKHLILTAPHPSPLSAHRGFLGCKHFSQANNYLREYGKSEINW